MPDNYDFKYSEREYEVRMLKKDIKMNNNDDDQDDRQEMNELIESDPELYGGDNDEPNPPKKSERDRLKAEIQNQLHVNEAQNNEQDFFDEDEISLEDPEDARMKIKERKEQESKIHNSFTGPYPLDPTEFSHTDKGANAQFDTMLR